MWARKNLPYYLATLALFILLKLAYRAMDVNALLFLLKPVNVLVSTASGINYCYLESQGFYYPALNLLIEKSCSGFNFLLICFVALCLLLINHGRIIWHRLLAFPLAMCAAYLATIVANASRLLVSVFVQQHGGMLAKANYNHLHEAEGVLIYLTSLIALYLAVEYLLKTNTPPNEKPA
jgi:exosortase K